MAMCEHCGQNPGPKAASEAIRNDVAELRHYRLHRHFPLNDHPLTHHGAHRIEIVRLEADRRSIRKIRRLALKQVARYWRESPELRRQYPGLGIWVAEAVAELQARRPRPRRYRRLGSRSLAIRHDR